VCELHNREGHDFVLDVLLVEAGLRVDMCVWMGMWIWVEGV
jgi:hypothetical protein